MESDVKRIIYAAIVKVLKPLVRIMLRNNIPYGTFIDIARWAYVDIAASEFNMPGRRQTDSRIATITGINRKEVKRLREVAVPDDLGASERYNRAARVIGGWIKDNDYTDSKSQPRELLMEGEKSFSTLVKKYSGDVPPRAILDELIRVGAAEIKNGNVWLISRGYIISDSDIDKLGIMGTDVSELVETIDHNMVVGKDNAFLQRKTSYDNIPEESLPEIRKTILEKGKEFVEVIDEIISRYDKDTNVSVKGEGRKKAGLGIFYFE